MKTVKTWKYRFPESLIEIGESAFKGCKSLKNIILPQGLNCIREGAFACSGLLELVLPKTYL